ncbi:hypothetical protein [Glycomyces sp. NPDC021274]
MSDYQPIAVDTAEDLTWGITGRLGDLFKGLEIEIVPTNPNAPC